MRRTLETFTNTLAVAVALAAGIAFSAGAGIPLPDSDGDGVPDEWDNCSVVANSTQLDSDTDGYGNVCDCDFDQDGLCDGKDVLQFGASYTVGVPQGSGATDLNGDGVVDGADFLIFGAHYNQPPGPSGLDCADPTGATSPCLPL